MLESRPLFSFWSFMQLPLPLFSSMSSRTPATLDSYLVVKGDSAMTLEWQVSQAEAGRGDGHGQRRVDGAHDHAWRRIDGDPYAVLLVYECGICHIEWAM